jgi:hypothetical protein
MRHVLTVLGFIGLVVGFLILANAHDSIKISQAAIILQLGGIFFAVGIATNDIVEAVKGSRRSTHS